MIKGFNRAFVGLIVGLLIWALDFSYPSLNGRGQFQLPDIAAAHAQALSCEFPPVDEPDDDGDECNPNFQQQITPAKNLGGKDPDCSICALVGDPINYTTGGFYDEETDYTSVGPFPIILKRYYNTQDFSGLHEFGAKRHSSYNRAVSVTSATVVNVRRDDGRVFTFTLSGGAWKSDADVNAQLTQTGSGWTYVSSRDETETYNASGRLVSLANRAGLTQNFAYDAQGRLATASDPYGRVLTFAYVSAASPLIARVTAPDGGVYAYAYDGGNRLTAVTFPDGSRRQYVYENAAYPNFLTGVIDEKGARYSTIAYDANGLAISSQHAGGADLTSVDYTYVSQGVTSVTNPLGGVTYYLLQGMNNSAKTAQTSRSCSNCSSYVSGSINNGYDANGNVISEVDFNGNTTTYVYDLTRNLQTSRTLASGEVIATTWHPAFRLPVRIIEPNRTTNFTYDAHGNLLSQSIVTPTITSSSAYTYNASGQPLTATDPNGNVTRFAYDAQGNLTSVTNALGQVTQMTSYDANGRPLTIQDPNGVVTTLTYNFRGQATSRTTAQWATSYSYDAVGQLIKLTNPDGSFLSFAYDAAHRLTDITDAPGAHLHYTLDAAGNRIKEETFDAANASVRVHNRAYDGLNRLSQDIGAQNQTTNYYYDYNDNLSRITDPNYNSTYRYFDTMNRLGQTYDAGGGSTTFTYDPKGRLASVRDARYLTTSYVNNGLDLPQTITSPDSGVTTKTFDPAGNVLTSTDARGATTSYQYDALNRVVRQTLANGNIIAFQYDQGNFGIGRLTGMTDTAGTTSWGYNRHGLVNFKQQTVGGVTSTTSRTYNQISGQLATTTYPSGSTIFYAYDANGRVSGLGYQPPGGGATANLITQIKYQPFGPVASWVEGNGASYSRSFDADGRIASLTLPAGDAIALSYDAASRITGITETGFSAKSFSYDSVDRVTGYSNGTTTLSYSYDSVGNRTGFSSTTPSLSLSYLYASTSNRLLSVSGSSIESYSYDAAGNVLTQATPAANYSFAYNVRNRMSQSTLGGIVTNYAVNGLGERVAKTPVGGAQVTFLYDEAGHMVGRYNPSIAYEETVYLGDLPVAVLEPGGPFYIAPDHLGAPHQLTNSAGGVVWLWDHDPFGNGQSTGALASYKARFPGQFADSETGLHYNYFRDYDPRTGRYVESDPIGLAGGVNTYGYVGGNPVGAIDPDGLCDCSHILEDANKLNDDSGYGFKGDKGPGANKNKCNAFVSDVLQNTGVAPRRWWGLGGPISAGTWADPTASIPNFPVVSAPKAGDIVAIAHNYADASGHVAIVSVPGQSTIGAGGLKSHTTGWPWDSSTTPQGTPVFRRCTCQ